MHNHDRLFKTIGRLTLYLVFFCFGIVPVALGSSASGSTLPVNLNPPQRPQAAIPLTGLAGDEYSPDLVFDPDLPAYMLTYGHYTEAGEVFYHTIEAQFVTPDGNPTGVPLLLSAQTPPMRDHPAAAYNSAAYNFLVVWDFRYSDTDDNIIGRIVSDGGAPLGSEIPIDTSSYDDSNPDLAYNPVTGEYLAVWERYQTDQSDIYAQRLDYTGTPIPGGGFYVAHGSSDESGAAVAVDSNTGEYFVVWHQLADPGNYDVYGQRVTSAGVLVDEELPISTATGNQMHPQLACSPDGEQYLVVWQDERIHSDIYAQVMSTAGELYEWNFAVADTGSTYRKYPQVAYQPNADDYMVTWAELTGVENMDVYRRRVARDGSLPEGQILVSGESTQETYPTIASGTSSLSHLIAWQDDRDVSQWQNIYGSIAKLNRFQGKVYQGEAGDESSPLDGADVSLYGSNSSGELGTLLETMTSAYGGWFAMIAPAGYEYYNLVESNPAGYASAAASSPDGTVMNADWIQYQIPLEEKELRNNKFWDVSESSLPDLVVTDAWSDGDQVCLQVLNQGNEPAPAGHQAALLVDLAQVDTLNFDAPIGAGARQISCFAYSYACTAFSTEIEVYADYSNLVTEADDDNNGRQESWLCDTDPPQITISPIAHPLSPSTVMIRWTTDEASDSRVRYDSLAGELNLEGINPGMLTSHQILLSGLSPSTAYHFLVESEDASGNLVASPEGIFITQPEEDSTNPSIDMGSGPVDCQSVFTFTVDASDTLLSRSPEGLDGIDKVKFLIDESLVLQQYSQPFEYTLDCSALPNGPHQVTGVAFDQAGNTASDHVDFSVAVPVDLTAPQVQILSPVTDQVVFGMQTLIQAALTDDVGLQVAYVSLDGKGLEVTPFAEKLKEVNYLSNFDTTTLENGKHRLHFNVIDTEMKGAQAYVDFIVANEAPPDLILTGHSASRTGNYFTVSITVENIGAGSAYNLEVVDTLQALQPISVTSGTQTSAASYDPNTYSFSIAIHDVNPLPAGGSRTFTYQAVPVMTNTTSSQKPVPSIGKSMGLEYRTQAGVTKYKPIVSEIAVVAGGDLLPVAHKKALQQANYLIATNPQRLFSNYNSNEVDILLSNLGALAVRRNGALGYTYYYDASDFDKQVSSLKGYNCGPKGCTTFTAQLAPEFQEPLGGALLIVGETEIMPTYPPDGYFKMSKYWGPVPLSDHPFADTGGGTYYPEPDLIVGRLIGDSAALLNKQVVASLGVIDGLPGHAFSREKAWLFSSYAYGTFIQDIESVANILQPVVSTIQKQHWKKYFQAGSFNLPLEVVDGFDLGDFGTGLERIVIGLAEADQIKILQANGTADQTLSQGFDAEDMLVTGNFIGAATDEILVADVSANTVHVWMYPNLYLGYFSLDIEAGDRLASADVYSGLREELIFADHSSNQIMAISLNEAPPFSGTVVGMLDIEFDPGDMLAACSPYDTYDPRVVVGDFSTDKILIRQFFTTSAQEIDVKDRPMSMGDMLSCGEMEQGDQIDSVVYGNAASRIWYYRWDSSEGKFLENNIPMHGETELFANDDFAVGNVGVYGQLTQDEIVIADWNKDKVLIMDTINNFSRMRAELPGYAQDADIIFWSGHGNKDLWEEIVSRNGGPGIFPINFNQHHPVILALSCLTGNYQEGTPEQEAKNIAEVFMDSGAAVYIGSTEESLLVSYPIASQSFFNKWTAGVSAGQAHTEMERSMWSGNPTDDWWFWVWEHNLYGDPLYGADTTTLHASAPPAAAPASLEITVPDYVFNQGVFEGGMDEAVIPGGATWLEPGKTMVPFYTKRFEYPEGSVISGVTLISHSDVITAEGINLPVSPLKIASTENPPIPQPGGGDGWFPEKDFVWVAQTNTDGTTSLLISVYPFDYNAQTTQVRFTKTYNFSVELSTPGLEVEWLAADKPEYDLGELVTLDVQLNDSVGPRDATAQVTLRHYATGELIAGLPLQTLNDLEGPAALSFAWDSTGEAAGMVLAALEVRGENNQLLAELTTTFSLGIMKAEALSLNLDPVSFSLGEVLTLTLDVENTGSLPMTGTAYLVVSDAQGDDVLVYEEDFSDLSSGGTQLFSTTWDTSGAAPGVYIVKGYAVYPGGGTEVLSTVVVPGQLIYLPIMKKP